MVEYFAHGCAVEGDKVSGSSRDPLRPRGLKVHRGERCWRYVASFNVKAMVDRATDCAKFEPEADVSEGSSVTCDRAMLHSSDSKPSSKVAMGSATHQANFWHFSDRTAVKVEQAHQDLVNGAAKNLAAAGLSALVAPTQRESKRLPK